MNDDGMRVEAHLDKLFLFKFEETEAEALGLLLERPAVYLVQRKLRKGKESVSAGLVESEAH